MNFLTKSETRPSTEHPSPSVMTYELESLHSHEILSVFRLPGRKLAICYQPEVRSKPAGLAVIDLVGKVDYTVQYHPLTCSPKDPFQGQFIKLSSDRFAVAIREASTSLRVSLVDNNWGSSPDNLQKDCCLIKVEDFIKDFCVEVYRTSAKTYLFVCVLMRNDKIKLYLVEPEQKKAHIIAAEVVIPGGTKIQRQLFIKVDGQNMLSAALECRELTVQENTFVLNLIGFSPRIETSPAMDRNTSKQYIPAVLAFIFKFDPKNPLDKLQSFSVNQFNSADSLTERKSKEDKNFEEFDSKDQQLKRGRNTSGLVAFFTMSKGVKADCFIAAITVPQKSKVVYYTWKLLEGQGPLEDYHFIISEEGVQNSTSAKTYVYTMYFENYPAIMESNSAIIKNILCVATKEVAEKATDLGLKIGHQINYLFDGAAK
jgi:hypothetical protein